MKKKIEAKLNRLSKDTRLLLLFALEGDTEDREVAQYAQGVSRRTPPVGLLTDKMISCVLNSLPELLFGGFGQEVNKLLRVSSGLDVPSGLRPGVF